MKTKSNCKERHTCFHCGNLIYDILELYDKKYNSELYCTHCNLSIKSYDKGDI